MELGLTGRVFVLTGATRGLGYAAAQQLVAEGARVVLSSRDPERVATAVTDLGDDRAVGLDADLDAPATPHRLVSAALDRFGRLDGALISVGGPPPGGPCDVDDDQWRRSFETVFLGAVRTARVVAQRLPAGAAIGFVLSASARSPIAGLGISNGLRPGLLGVAKDLADALGPRGIRVVSLLPGRIDTDRSTELFALASDPAAARADVEAGIPLGRLGTPEEFGRVAAFVLSPAASYLTGLAIPVDGGAARPL
ncbi:MAG: SDR family oxidoreductase [Dactylosporangium sp.]|nr:SDR family oxidoreductase [Dactylosporangium sp.]NNJ60556.1 SDR family oxidoreductase [Dactylosporangium sp.]